MDILTVFRLISDYLLSIVLPLAIGLIVIGILYFTVRYILKKSGRAEAVRKAIMIIIKEPVPVVVLGFVVYYIYTLHPGFFPTFATSGKLVFIIELILLAVSINASRKISNILVLNILKLNHGGRRFLLIGVYSAGLVALFYIVFTSPISPAVASNTFQVVSFVSGLIATYIIAYVINLVITRYQATIRDKQPQLHTTITFARRVTMGIVVLIGAAASGFAAFPSASGAIASLFVAAGFTSIVIGLAAQSSLSNLIAGGVVATSQPFKIGDTITYDGNYCTVEDIKLMTTTLKIWDGRRLIVPNKMFLDTSVINYSSVDPSMYMILYIEISPDSDVDRAIEIMTKAALEHPSRVPVDGLPVTAILGFTESGINLRTLSYTTDQNTAYQMQRDLRYSIIKEFNRHGIRLAFPRRELQIGDDDRKLLSKHYNSKDDDKPPYSDSHGQGQ